MCGDLGVEGSYFCEGGYNCLALSREWGNGLWGLLSGIL